MSYSITSIPVPPGEQTDITMPSHDVVQYTRTMFKSEKREKKKERRKFPVHGRRFAEIIRNAILKRNMNKDKIE